METIKNDPGGGRVSEYYWPLTGATTFYNTVVYLTSCRILITLAIWDDHTLSITSHCRILITLDGHTLSITSHCRILITLDDHT